MKELHTLERYRIGGPDERTDESLYQELALIPFFAGMKSSIVEMFSERISLVFKKLRVVRMVDSKRNTLVYLVYSYKLVEGSPKNSVTAVQVPATQPIPLK